MDTLQEVTYSKVKEPIQGKAGEIWTDGKIFVTLVSRDVYCMYERWEVKLIGRLSDDPSDKLYAYLHPKFRRVSNWTE